MVSRLSVLLSAVCLLLLESACGKEEKSAPGDESGSKEKQDVELQKPEIPAEPKTLPGLENGVLKITAVSNGHTEKKKIRVQDDSLHIQYLPLKGKAPALPGSKSVNRNKRKWDIISPRSRRSLAESLLPLRKNYIVWAPKQDPETRQVKIPDVQLCRDQSVLALVENHGETGAQASRIILFDTASWEILRIFTVKRKVQKIALPDTVDVPLAVYCAEQSPAGQKSGIVLLDWKKNGEETDFAPVLPKYARFFFYDRTGALWHGGGRKLWIKNEELTHMRSEAAAISPDGKLFAVAGKGGVDVYETGSLNRTISFSYSGNGMIRQIIFLDNTGKNFLLSPEADANLNSKEAFVLRGGKQLTIPGWTAGFNAVSGDGTRIYAVKQVKGEMETIDAGTMQPIRTIAPSTIQPKVKGDRDIRAVFPMDRSGLLAVLDSAGTFSLLFLPEGGKKYEKEILFTAVP